MYLSVYAVVCCAILSGFTTAAENKYHQSDLTFNEDADIEGSGTDGEVTHDLESSGSGFGPDDEDTPIHVPEVNRKLDENVPSVSPKLEIDETPKTVTVKSENIPTEDPTVKMNVDERPTSFFAQPGILAAVIGGAVVGLLCAILVVMFIVYRMRKKDEGSYSLGERKESPVTPYNRGSNNKEFYA